MSKVIHFIPLDQIGECPLDLHSCPRRFEVPDLEDEYEAFYQAPELWRWIHHHVYDCPHEGRTEVWAEVNPKYVAERLMDARLNLPPELDAAWEAVKESRKEGWGICIPNPYEPIEEGSPAQPATGKARQPAKPSGPPAKRNQGKADRCRGHYLAFIERGETPPSIEEIARQVGCDVGTASRALKGLEGKRRALARNDSRNRYQDHVAPPDLTDRDPPLEREDVRNRRERA
jgi:hypothetical protein